MGCVIGCLAADRDFFLKVRKKHDVIDKNFCKDHDVIDKNFCKDHDVHDGALKEIQGKGGI